MSASANPTATPAAAQLTGPKKAPVRRLNRRPLLIAVITGVCVTGGALTVAIDRANRRTVQRAAAVDHNTSEALARSLTHGRPDGTIGARPAESAPVAAAPAPTTAPPPATAQPAISRQAAAAPVATDPMEEVRKRLALQRFERLEQEKQRIELALIQGHEEALGSPTAIDMARGSYARTADRVRNGMVGGGPLTRAGVVAAAPALRGGVVPGPAAVGSGTVRTAWASGGGAGPAGTMSFTGPPPTGVGGAGGEFTPLATGNGFAGGGGYGGGYGGASGGGYGGPAAAGFAPGYLGALRHAQFAPDPNGQGGKLDFLQQQTEAQGYLAHFVQAPLSPYELKKGSVIPATMITGVNSDLPGRMIAQVNQNVYDSATGRYLLIPQGSRLFGRYDANVTYGQERVLVVWTDLTFPDGSTLHLGAMAGTDQAGYGGFADRVDNHELRIYGSALLISLVGAASEYAVATARGPNVGNVSISLGEAGVNNVSSTFGNVVRQTLQKNLAIQPTIEIRPGYRFNVIVEKDIVFPPYGP